MAKKRFYFGKILKGAEGKPDFLVIDKDITLKEGQFVNLESKKQRLDDLQESVSNGRLSEETASSLREKVNKLSDRVRFSLYIVREN
jgi:CRISPR/Cas system-associated endoribonuclease Cas2